ncbi:unnamed protein product [Mytilus coruscus]|uniref:Uncharacterized protein n=1 Tax=Mytilus coruscus TaxID=42192 RepID=A0A6J8CPQ9_MYTCO|nr:unnamed protein product [Mytilus coruscus]
MDEEDVSAMDHGGEYDLVDISIYELSDTADTESINTDDPSSQRSSLRNRRNCLWSIIFSWIVFPITAGNLLPDVIGRRHSRDGQISSIVTLKTAIGILIVLMYIRFSPGKIEGKNLYRSCLTHYAATIVIASNVAIVFYKSVKNHFEEVLHHNDKLECSNQTIASLVYDSTKLYLEPTVIENSLLCILLLKEIFSESHDNKKDHDITTSTHKIVHKILLLLDQKYFLGLNFAASISITGKESFAVNNVLQFITTYVQTVLNPADERL